MQLELHSPARARAGAAWWRAPPVPKKASSLPSRERLKAAPTAAFLLVVGLTLLVLFAPRQHLFGPSAVYLAALLSASAGAVLLRERARRGQKIFAAGLPALLAWGLAAWTALAAPFSVSPKGSAALLFTLFLQSIVLFLLVGAAVDSLSRLRQLAWTLTLLAAPLAAFAIAGRSSQPEVLALFFTLLFPITLALIVTHSAPVGRAVLFIAAALEAGAVLSTHSLARIATLFIVLIGFAWTQRRSKERVLIWAALALTLAGLVAMPGDLAAVSRVAAEPAGFAQTRFRDIQVAVGQVMARPLFGAGLGMGSIAFNAAPSEPLRAIDNVYLQYAADLGLPGLALFLALFATCMSGLAQARKKLETLPDKRELLVLADGVLLGVVAFALAGCLHPVGYHFPIFYMAGLAVAVRGIALGRTQ